METISIVCKIVGHRWKRRRILIAGRPEYFCERCSISG